LEGVVYDVTLARKWLMEFIPLWRIRGWDRYYQYMGASATGIFFTKLHGMFPVVGTIVTSDSTPTVPANKKVLRFYIDKTDYYIDDQVQAMDTAPIIKDDRTLLPIRYVATPFGSHS
jgi:Copper amine oxidase N-terminal domain